MGGHVRTTIRYDGPALAGHEMDVQDLAPALLALAEIIQTANRKFNGDHAAIKVLVNADVDQKCFQIDISLVQSIIDRAKSLFETDTVKTALEIAKAVGIVGGSTLTLFKLIKWFSSGGKGGGTEVKVESDNGSTVIVVNGDGNTIAVPSDVYRLASDPGVLERAKDVLRPLTKPGYETLAFLENDKPVETFNADEAREAVALRSEITEPKPPDSISEIIGPVRIKTPQYEGNAKWGVIWGGRTIEVSMPAEWVRKFQANEIHAPPGTILKVKMTQAVPRDKTGLEVGAPTFTVTDVIEIIPPPKQGSFLTD